MNWPELPPGTGFGLANLPYGVFSRNGEAPRACVRVWDAVLDLAAALGDPVFARGSLNAFMAQGHSHWRAVRADLTEMLTRERYRDAVEAALHPLAEVTLHLPFEVADYVDFYASEYHASNVGRILRPGGEPLTPNWKHMPVGYHGRAGTVVVSGTPIVRPCGQRRARGPGGGTVPEFGPSRRLDFEAEVGFVVGTGSRLGEPVSAGAFGEHVFGVCLVNDWSARDIQAWESAPLGPFLGKSFGTSISPWVVPADALAHARTAPPPRDRPLLPYLAGGEEWGLDLALEVQLNGHVISRPPYATMYWTPAQMLAHLTAGGASLRTGDLYASGTVSGPAREERGSLLELSWGGRDPLTLPDGTTRCFLEDGDEVTIIATAPGPGGERIGFGEVSGRIVAAGAD